MKKDQRLRLLNQNSGSSGFSQLPVELKYSEELLLSDADEGESMCNDIKQTTFRKMADSHILRQLDYAFETNSK
jgi:hypothetical protein